MMTVHDPVYVPLNAEDMLFSISFERVEIDQLRRGQAGPIPIVNYHACEVAIFPMDKDDESMQWYPPL
jgi:hypothetical protein